MFKLGIKWEKEQIFTQTDQLKNGNTLQYNALPTELRGTCHEWWAYFKVIHDTTTRVYMWCKEQVSKESKEQAFWFLSNMT